MWKIWKFDAEFLSNALAGNEIRFAGVMMAHERRVQIVEEYAGTNMILCL